MTTNHIKQCFLFILLILVIYFAAPILRQVSAQSEPPDAEWISDQSLLTIDSIQISGNVLLMECKLPLEMDQATFMARLLPAMYLSIYNTPQIEQVKVIISFMEEPFGTLSVTTNAVIAAYTEQMEPQQFLDSLQWEDHRPAKSIFFHELYQFGIVLSEFTLEGETLTVNYFSEPYSDKLLLFEDWTLVLNLTANLYPQIQETSIGIIIPKNSSQLITTFNMDEYSRYSRGEINLLDFMTTLKFNYGDEQIKSQDSDNQKTELSNSNETLNSKIGTVFCSGIFLLIFLVSFGLGLYLLISKKSTLWGILLMIIVALPACLLMLVFIGAYFYNNV